ncbi:hypothetical protein D9M70_498190 [compost metagenome]
MVDHRRACNARDLSNAAHGKGKRRKNKVLGGAHKHLRPTGQEAVDQQEASWTRRRAEGEINAAERWPRWKMVSCDDLQDDREQKARDRHANQ